ncbi:hypothetical protein EZV73_19825 [Acidaminobacter sp. JC074]|uniref:stalk domain-containing protein n=1 Tax=Acidaminobacter sp. JC074 TaxID=2530199 RepID=UPI001F0E35BD|nr:glucosaminidase domain-containing protein [Acidaminobacter sp. JC074]MCH4889843.1 hypothetical protein [Acidaminobacter sp. JC074]
MKKTIIIITLLAFMIQATFATDIQLFVNDINITETSSPIIVNDRLMVPIKFVTEELGGQVSWDETYRTVSIKNGDNIIKLWIDSPVFEYNGKYDLSDVAPIIHNDRTYVPVKLVSNLFGVEVKWDGVNRHVKVDDSLKAEYEGFYDMSMRNITSGMTIESEMIVEVDGAYDYDSLKLLLLDPNDMRGYVVASGSNGSAIRYIPKVEDMGKKVLVAAYYDENRKLVAADAKAVNLDVKPVINLLGLDDYSKEAINISQTMNFIPKYINYEITEVSSGNVTSITKRDPIGSYSFKPTYEKNGDYNIQVIAVDGLGQTHYSEKKTVTFDVDRYLYMGGVSENATVNKEVSLIASRNFDVNETSFILRDVNTGLEETLAVIPWGSYKWFPDMTYHGEKELIVSVKDVNDNIVTSPPKRISVDGSPKLLLKGVGPNQVLTSSATLSVSSNVDVADITYHLVQNGDQVLASGLTLEETFDYMPSSSGKISIYASGNYQGQTIKSDTVTLNTYLEKLYSSKPIIEKSEFKYFASDLALESFHETGMSASLQVAQAILETGWGQYVPVDKYSGKFSNNLFGIKGSASNGSVTSNTWEVYNGVSFRTDADFRAYHTVKEAWLDHKNILKKSRYEPYREVMYDSTLAAYAIRRCGYATDPNYPMKLINIIDKYDLKKLDRVGIYLY